MYESHRANLDELVREADLANLRAIASLGGGGGDEHFFDPAPQGAATWRCGRIYRVYLADDVPERTAQVWQLALRVEEEGVSLALARRRSARRKFGNLRYGSR